MHWYYIAKYKFFLAVITNKDAAELLFICDVDTENWMIRQLSLGYE